METTQQKFHPNVMVRGEYLGSFEAGNGGQCDFYLDGNTCWFEWGHSGAISAPLCDIERDAHFGMPNSTKALALIRSHRARTPAPSAPAAMSTYELIKYVAGVLARTGNPDATWPGDWEDEAQKRLRAEAALVVYQLRPDLAPPPPPQKSEGEKIAESVVSGNPVGQWIHFKSVNPEKTGFVSASWALDLSKSCVEHPVTIAVNSISAAFAASIDAALDARDAEHRAALEPLLKLIDQPYRDTYSQYEPYIREIREQARKLAERSAAK